MNSKDKSRRLMFLFPWTLILLEAVHFLVRWMLLNSPFFSQVDYDEGITGLMALHILRGEPQLMIWGLPRLGGLEAYFASFIFYLFGPSTFAFQFSLILVSSVILMTVYAIGGKMGGPKAGIIAAAYWAIPPVFLSFTGNYIHGGHPEAILAGSLILYGICTFDSLSPPKTAALWALIGVISGIGWWSSLLVMPFLLVAVIGMIGTRPGMVLSPLPWLGAAGYLVGSLPFWTWNYFHDFNTLLHLGGGKILSVFQHLPIVVAVTIPTFIGTFWDGQAVSSIPKSLAFIIQIVFYFPVLLISLAVFFHWLWRIESKKSPFQRPIDYIVLTFLAYFFIRAADPSNDLGITRYTLVLFVPVSLLVSFWINKIIHFRKVLGWGLLFCLLGFNLLTNIVYLDQNKNNPVRPVDDLIRTFQKLGIRYCYGDSRITQVIDFESQEKIISADFSGWRNYDYLKTVDRAPAQEIAIITHRKLRNPYPETMEAGLQLLGCTFEKKEVGDYVFFYHFKKSDNDLRSIPTGEWKVTASQGAGQCFMVKDRDILTAWRISKRAGEWLQVDLGEIKKVGQISLLPGPIEPGLPYQFKLEISKDGRAWKTIRAVKDYLPGLYWYNGHPRLDENLCLQIVFPLQEGRYLRITNLIDAENPNDPWTIAEFFVYEAALGMEQNPKQATKNLDQARNYLDHWMDDPTGPQPTNYSISTNFRKKQVDWTATIRLVSQVIREAPDWEEAHQLLGQTLMLGDFWNCAGMSKSKSEKNPLNLFSEVDFSLIPLKPWKVISNFNGQEAKLAIDGDPFTRWTSLKAQEPGMFFQVDLGGDYQVNGFSLFLGSSLNDYPRSLKVLSSLDKENWQEVQAASHFEYAFYQNCLCKKVLYRIDPVRVRYLRLMETGKDPVFWWSIYELEVFGEKEK